MASPFQILSQIPFWVLPLFALLLVLGLRATKARSVPIVLVYMLPLLGILTLRTLTSLPRHGLVWPLAVAGFILGLRLGRAAMARYVTDIGPGRITLRGEWLTLATVMGLFWMNFACNTLAAVAPTQFATVEFNALAALVLGGLAGLFPGRAIYVLRRTGALPA